MDTTFRPRFFQTPRLSQVLLVGAVILALVAALLLYAGSQQHRLPPPFGVARNGALVSSADGDILTIEPSTGRRTTVVGGDTFDFGPLFSRDGTRFSFLRVPPSGCGKPDCGLILAVANADGTAIRELTPGLERLDSVDWSPDGSRIAILTAPPDGPGHTIAIVAVDGSGMHALDLGRPAVEPNWLPPSGDEIVFRGEQLSADDPPAGIFAVRSDGTHLRPILTRATDYRSPAVAPDGHAVTYQDTGPDNIFQVHILDLRTGEDRVLPRPADTAALGAVFSPDGRLVVYIRAYPDNTIQLAVAPADGSSTGTAIGPHAPFLGPEGPTINNYLWSPDGTAILANYDADKAARLVPIDGSPAVELARGDLAFPAYQRLAP
jgi:Tol biopolymer transport system component